MGRGNARSMLQLIELGDENDAFHAIIGV